MNYFLFISIVTQYPIWFSIFCLVLGGLYSYLLYFFKPKEKEFSKKERLWLSTLRGIVVSVISFLLLSPFFKTITTEKEKPIIIAQDNSESIRLAKNATAYLQNYNQQIQQLIQQLSNKFEVRTYTFGNNIKENPTNFSLFKEQETNISNMFKEIETRYLHRNVGALILATDGIYNKGDNPLYDAMDFSFPIYSIALGDTTVYKDLIIKKINSNTICMYNNYFPVEITIQANKCSGAQTNISISKNDTVIASQTININSNTFNKTVSFLIKANQIGNQQYKIQVSEVNGEVNKLNNKADLFIQVIESKHKILILGNSPHPDIAAIKQALETSQTMQVDVNMIDKFNGSLNAYQLVILHQLPSNKNTCTDIIAHLQKNTIPALFIIGNQSAITAINNLKYGIQLGGYRAQTNEAVPELDELFPLFSLTTDAKNLITQLPPMISPFGQYQVQSNVSTLFKQKIKGIHTEQPLWAFNTINNQKVGIIYGENLWKWRLFNFSQKNNHHVFDEIMFKTTQYLLVKEDKSPLRIIHQNTYLKNQAIEIAAELYDQSSTMIEDAEIAFKITHPNKKQFTNIFTFTNGKYNLNLGQLPVGVYKYEASCIYKNQPFKKSGEFNVVTLNLEASQTIANHQLLHQLSKRKKGSVFNPYTLDKLSAEIMNRTDIQPIAHHRKNMVELINLPASFLFIILLLGLEWFFRKQLGSY